MTPSSRTSSAARSRGYSSGVSKACVLLFLRSEGYIRLKADSAIPSAALYGIYCMWCSDNAYKPRSARTVSMTLKKHADEFGLEHDNHIQNALGKRVNGFWGIEALVTPPVL